jgi:hypothetical protein
MDQDLQDEWAVKTRFVWLEPMAAMSNELVAKLVMPIMVLCFCVRPAEDFDNLGVLLNWCVN